MPEEHKLLRTHKNRVLKILQKRGLEPANFSWKQRQIPDTRFPPPYKAIIVPRLEYIGGEYYFQFEPYSCTFSPGQRQIVQHKSDVRADDQAVILVEQWAYFLSREITAPDLWAEMEKYKTSISLTPAEQIVNEPIPANEVEKISEQLSSLADKIEEGFELTNEQNQFVRSKLNYLAEAAKRQRSMDWAHNLIGVSVTIMMGLALAPDEAKEIWELIRSFMGGFIHLIGP